MKFQNLSSILLFLILLCACNSTELTLRHSKVNKQIISEDFGTQESIADTPTPSNISSTTSPTITVQSTIPSDMSTSDLIEEKSDIQEEKLPIKQTQHKQRTYQTQKHIIQSTYQQTKVLATKNMQKVNGVFGGIGHAFGVVGLVFLFVGIILLLIGGIIIDTLGALFIGFGFLFLLIWLVLIILQVVFDVIL